MVPRIVEFALGQRALIFTFGLLLLVGGLYAFHQLDVVAYPDPSPPMVEVITQNPALSAEEIERQITLPIEFALAAMPGLTHIRSISLFGLSDVKFYFDYGTDYFKDRQEVLNRLGLLTLPSGVQPTISPWWALAEIYRYQLVGTRLSLTDLKTIQDWQLNREFKRVPGVIDVTGFGGTTKQYLVELDPGLLLSHGVSVPQVASALSSSNANAGGSYLTAGAQSFDVRGLGLIRDLDDIEDVVVAEKQGVPTLVKHLGDVDIGHRIRLGKVGVDDDDDAVEGIVLLMRGYHALPVLERVKQKVEEINHERLPPGVTIKTIYDRTWLIHTTVETVVDILLTGILFVFIILFVFLGHVRTAVIVASAVPLALLVTFIMMVLFNQSANLISLGAIDFGIIVDSTLLMVENVFYQLTHRREAGAPVSAHVMRAAHDVGRPIFFATIIIIVAFIPLFTMTGVPGKIFAPMSLTYGLALSGALLMAFTLAPVLCATLLKDPLPEEDTRLVRWIRQRYLEALEWALDHEKLVIGLATALFVVAIVIVPFLGGEFMPALEEGNLWVRATLPVGIAFEEAGRLVKDMRAVFRRFPEVTTVVSQLGRPDDGTDPTSFFNVEFLADLKPRRIWRSEIHNKLQLIAQIETELSEEFPGVTFNFSQVIQDNVQEAMSGVKGENSIKLFGPDLEVLEAKAAEIKAAMEEVRGIKDLGTFHVLGQPNLLIEVDRPAVARYGLEVADVNGIIQAAIGGQTVTQVFEGEKWFDLVVRFLPQFRKDAQTIRDIQVATPDGSRIPLKQLAVIKESIGGFIVYRENTQRYIPIKFSVRGRDLEGAVNEAAARIRERVSLPPGYRIEWHGEYNQLQIEKRRLMEVVPLSLFVILLLVTYALYSLRDGLLVLSTVPFAMIGGVFSLALTGTHLSISAAVGFVSLFGVAIQGALVDLSRLHEYIEQGLDLKSAILRNAAVRMRPVMMTTLAAAIGLLPAAVATGIGAQSQQPLARVVVGGMLSSVTLILLVLPVLYQRVHRGVRQRTAMSRKDDPLPPTMVHILFFAVLILALMGCSERTETDAPGSTGASDKTGELVHVSPKAHREIVVEPAQVQTVTEGLTLQGRIQYNPDHFVRLSSPLVGLVKAVLVKLGEQVKVGQVLATIESADIGIAYADFAKAESDLELAKRNYGRARDLYEAHSISKKEFDQAQNDLLKDQAEYRRARLRLVTLKVLASELARPRAERRISDRFDLKSPIDGVVVEKNLTIGQMVGTDPSLILFVIGDLDVLQAVADVYERDLHLIGEGMAVSVEVQSFPHEAFQGTVAYVGDVVDPTTRTTKVRCNLNNLDHKLKPEMFARIHIMKPVAESLALAVPREALITIGDEAFLFVEKTETEYERRHVVAGPMSGDLVEIHEGLKAGERVVVRGALLLEGAWEARKA